jgi:SNF2 family DNA or RNA helicase
MQIDYQGGAFIGLLRFEEREVLRRAGWTWDKIRRQWLTLDPSKTIDLRSFCTDSAIAALDAWGKHGLSALALSMAEDLDVAIPAPPGLAYDPFQKPGIIYAAQRHDTLIADPPGLGKTIQVVGVSNYLPAIRRVLVVCPASLTVNWSREWARWCVKGLTVGLAGSKVKREKLEGVKTDAGRQAYRSWTEHVWPATSVVIMSYDMLPTFEAEARATTWDLLICDESQYLVSAKTVRSRHVFGAGKQFRRVKGLDGKIKRKVNPAVAPLPARKRVFLSGTPILSRPIDIWTLCEACDPAGLGKNWKTFVYEYCNGHEEFGRLDVSGASNLEVLQRKLREAFMVRRDKVRVLSQLPPKRRQLIELPAEGLAKLIDREASAATKVKRALADFERIIRGEPDAPEVEWRGLQEALERRFGALASLDYLDRARHLTAPEQVAFEEFSAARQELAAAKLPMVVEHLENSLATGRKIICFVIHTELAEALRAHFPGCAFITGKVAPTKRQAEVDRFQTDPACTLMIGNIHAAGAGFTMTASDWVIFAELDWVPAVIEQAEDRAWRRGQLNAVLVQHLAVEGSVDCRFVEVLIDKMQITHAALDANALSVLTCAA